MARIFDTGFEIAQVDIGDISPLGGNFTPPSTRGPWSAYAYNSNLGIVGWDAAVSDFYWGTGFYLQSNGALHGLEFMSANSIANIELAVDSGNKLVYKLGRDGTVIVTSTRSLGVGKWYYLEGHIVIHDTTGSLELKIDGQVESSMTISGTDTRNDLATCNRMRFADSNVAFDDVYVNDTTAPDNADYSGDIQIKGYVGNAAGDVTGLTRGGTDSGSNFGQVDEVPANDDTDYAYGTDTTVYDLYNLPSISADFGSVQSMRLWIRAKKTGGGAANIAHMLKVDTDASGTADTENQGADVALSAAYVDYSKGYDRQPGPSSWTPAKGDALQIGVKSR